MVEEKKAIKGYKHTDLGIIPSDWELKRIGEVCHIFGRIGFRGYTVNDIVKEGDGAITISPSNIKDNKIEFQKCTYISWFKYEESPEIKIFNGDVLLVKTGSTFGKTAIVKNLPINATINPQLVVLKKIKIDNFFLSYLMGFKAVQQQIASSIVGGAISTLSQKLVSNFVIPLPPTKAEQTAIATALNDADALITGLEKLIAKKRAIKQGAMQELLRPKEGWEVKKLGDCLKQSPDYGINAAAVIFNESLPVYLRITDITDDGRFSKRNIVSVDNISSSSYYLEPGDLVFARTGASVGKTYLYNSDDGELVFAGFLIRIKTNPEILNPVYFQYYTQSADYWKWILSNSMRTGQPGINGKEYKELELYLPTIQEQVRNANILYDIDAEIEGLEKKLDKYKMIKQGMMKVLLTGKLRLIKNLQQ